MRGVHLDAVGEPVSVGTITGSFMFSSATALEVWQLVRSGAIDLTPIIPHTFDLDDFEAGLAAARDLSGFEYAVLIPGQL
ncbi:MAG: hypothetical protein H0V92_00225 [Pseudonocardiales bacterium]|nr:hypothetical protein [Pseudonocardiales bacterium]